jgi:hypothetical protein
MFWAITAIPNEPKNFDMGQEGEAFWRARKVSLAYYGERWHNRKKSGVKRNAAFRLMD